MKELTEQNVNEISKGLVFIDFWAEWCGPCKMMSPIFQSLSEDYGDKIAFYKNNVDEFASFAKESNIMSIPTFILFRDGKEVFRIVGTKTQSTIATELQKFIET